MRIVGRIFYGIAAALGLLSIGTEVRDRQLQAKQRGPFARHPAHTGLFVGLWASVFALVGKVFEDYAREHPATTTGATSRPNMRRHAQTLRSDYDLSDQYAEQATNRHPQVAAPMR